MEITQHYDLTWLIAGIFILLWLVGSEAVYVGLQRFREYRELRKIRKANNHLMRYSTRRT